MTSARRLVPLLAAALSAALALTSCSAPSSGAKGNAKNVVLGVSAEPETLNPILGYAPDGAAKIFDGLVAYDADLNLVPSLAKKLPETSDGGKTYTYHLRKGVTFHDGKPLTSEDVAFTYRKVLDEDVNSTIRSDFAAVESIETPDKYTVVFHLKYPYAPFPKRTTLGIVPEHALAGKDIDSAAFNRDPIGTGPYEFVKWRPGDRLVLKANEQYWGGAPAVRRVTVAFVSDANTRAARLAAGELDGAALPPKLARGFRNDDSLVVRERKTADYRAITMPMGNPVTSDRAVRRAMNIGVDRQAMVKGILLGQGVPAYGPLPPAHKWYEKSIERPYDPAKAKRILQQAGWTMGPNGVRVKDGQPARFTLLYPAGDTLRKDVAVAFADQMSKLGIDVKVQGLGWDAITPRMRQDAVVFGGGAPYDPDFVAYGIYHSSVAGEGFLNPGHYDNPRADELLEKGRHSADPQVRERAYRKLQKVQARNPAMIFCVYLRHLYVMRDAWNGIKPQVEPHAHGLLHGPWWNLADWKPKP